MTKIEELEQKLNELKYQIRNTIEGFEETCEEFEIEIHELKFEYQKALAELKESKKEGKWKPKDGEKYWLRDTLGELADSTWDEHNIDEWRYNNLPIFPTKEACERYWHFMDTVKEKSYEFSKEELVDTNIEKWYIGLKHGGLCVDFVYGVGLFGATYFKTEEDAQYIIDNFKDELMEYFV